MKSLSTVIANSRSVKSKEDTNHLAGLTTDAIGSGRSGRVNAPEPAIRVGGESIYWRNTAVLFAAIVV